MIRKQTPVFEWSRAALRHRYRPKAPLCRGLIACAPWVSLALLVGAFLLLRAVAVFRSGILVELPAVEVDTGTGRGLTAVVLAHKDGLSAGSRAEMVFFDDEPFLVADRKQMLELRRRFMAAGRDHPDAALIIEADVNASYGTIVDLCGMAREAGLKLANLAQRPPEGSAGE